ncbi:Uncharacterised protein family UPF0090 [Striga hermonthica]|uniref:Uncharacterized protein n=1 Tax=Striga hermonthica TaxID=68872 RepID=A0A9N7RIW8_STRHE|nr:Uncharacterised protein family UPF0090 [Striga hermonthica]
MDIIASIRHPYKNPLSNPALISPPPRASMAVDFNTAHFPYYPRPFPRVPKRPSIAYARKKNAQREPVVGPPVVEEATAVDEDFQDDIFLEDFEDDELVDDDGDFEDEYLAEEAEPSVGDGAGGGGISLAGMSWDQRALDIAQEVTVSFDGELGIYAFRTLLNASIQVRIERLTNKSGSPNMADIEEFATRYQAQLDEAEANGSIPVNIYLELTSSSFY